MAIKAIDANFEKESFTAFLLSSADVSDLVRCICFLLRLFCFQSLSLMRPNAQVNRQECEAFLSVLNLQLGIRLIKLFALLPFVSDYRCEYRTSDAKKKAEEIIKEDIGATLAGYSLLHLLQLLGCQCL
jgi:hypothetical protein